MWTVSDISVTAPVADLEAACLEVVVFEVEVISLQRSWPGNQASMSYFFAAEAPRSPAADVDDAVGNVELFDELFLDREEALVLVPRRLGAVVKTNISTLSNWCTRNIPRVSLPAAPASRRKQVE